MVNYQAWGHTGPPPTNFAGPLPGTQTTFITPFCSMKPLLAGDGGWWGVSSALLLRPGCLLQCELFGLSVKHSSHQHRASSQLLPLILNAAVVLSTDEALSYWATFSWKAAG